MKPFDLEAAKAGKPIVTRDGRTVRFIAYVADASSIFKVVSLVPHTKGTTYPNSILRHQTSGRYMEETESKHDLFMAPIVKTYWANVHKYSGIIYVGNLFSSKEDLDLYTRNNNFTTVVKQISFEIEE